MSRRRASPPTTNGVSTTQLSTPTVDIAYDRLADAVAILSTALTALNKAEYDEDEEKMSQAIVTLGAGIRATTAVRDALDSLGEGDEDGARKMLCHFPLGEWPEPDHEQAPAAPGGA